jgi:hypothetical protein
MISAFIVAIIWGITPIIYKSILNDLSYHTILIFSGLTFFIASIFYTIIYYKEISNDIKIYPHKLHQPKIKMRQDYLFLYILKLCFR